MRSFASLIRLHKWKLEEKRRKLAELERLRGGLLAQGERLGREMAAEQEAAGTTLDAARGYAPYAEAAILRRRTLERSLDNIAQQIVLARDEVTVAFQELRKHELLAERRLQLARAAEARSDQTALDEAGAQGHRRRHGR
jgi:hypothetical protein